MRKFSLVVVVWIVGGKGKRATGVKKNRRTKRNNMSILTQE